mmetsp:Transcript_3120/g.6826  ORF Transcript_3120/g.6826 Transcript_3120/m.6826 type:complete len:185 (-) Transcript_3120:46-600(-)|eukprot:CAMPEP_0172175948 /NCGR_PEP_ID=MMETSP1050-20130122/14523_1 /TAXON_ID=233186 /ORGANISM="Cryptomonas curvata, Strain CCAP979/52" /LENGTH=184 /DNA_ID=CAMNT_0012848131 /DNA_START=77 /DNA_END=631 /DNA_ORIENTATION=+
MQSSTCQKTCISSGARVIPELIELLSDSSPHSPDTQKLESMSLEDILNFDSDAAEDTSDSDFISGHDSMSYTDEPCSPTSRARAVIQDPFDELALSPRNESCSDFSFPDLLLRNFPRARSSDYITTRIRPSSGESIYEPTRPWTRAVPAPPPRRFYKFWWRGIIRGAYEAARVARLAGAAQRNP